MTAEDYALVEKAAAAIWPKALLNLFGDTRRRQQFGHDNADYQHPNHTPSFI